MKNIYKILTISLLVCFTFSSFAKDKKKKENKREFKSLISLDATDVKSQGGTGTCWDFATTSFIESELLRMGKGAIDLSEMFTVRHVYPVKARRYYMMHGNYTFAQGGLAHDVTNAIKLHGMVPEVVYDGLQINESRHNHGELNAVLQAMMKAVVSRRTGAKTPVWDDVINKVLDTYLGEAPESFEYEGKTYTPKSFQEELGFNPEDYVEFTSYSYYPMYETCQIEVPDNWSMSPYYNVPMDDFMAVLYNSLENGYTVAWGGDVSDTYFSHKNGVALVPQTPWTKEMKVSKDAFIKDLQEEKEVSQADRDETFFNYSTTDDHLMHLTGIVQDQNGTKYFVTKNSWGVDSNEFGGYLNMSEEYVKLRTIAFMVHKDAVPAALKAKLGIK
jgi:bleomycin hydrolase